MLKSRADAELRENDSRVPTHSLGSGEAADYYPARMVGDVQEGFIHSTSVARPGSVPGEEATVYWLFY